MVWQGQGKDGDTIWGRGGGSSPMPRKITGEEEKRTMREDA